MELKCLHNLSQKRKETLDCGDIFKKVKLASLRHVGVIWSNFHVSNFCQLDLHNKTHGCISKPTMKICKNHIVNWTSPDLVMVIKSVCLLIS